MQLEAVAPQTKPADTRPPRVEAPAASSSVAFALRPAAAAADHRYTVKHGDNLTRIVRKQLEAQGGKVSNAKLYEAVSKVARENQLRDADVIHPGQVLDLRALHPQPATLASAVEPVDPFASSSLARREPVHAAPKLDPVEPFSISKAADFQATRRQILPEESRGVAVGPPPLGGPTHLIPMPSPRLVAKAEAAAPVPKADLGKLLEEILNPPATPQAATTEGVSLPSPWAKTLAGPARLTSDYGMRPDPFTGRLAFHDGIDLAAEQGTIIYPIRPGVVTFSGWQGGYGKIVIVKHEDGVETVYAHNAKNAVREGQRVDESTPLGQVGSTGRSTGPHLHFEIRKNGVPLNPVAYFEQQTMVQAKK